MIAVVALEADCTFMYVCYLFRCDLRPCVCVCECVFVFVFVCVCECVSPWKGVHSLEYVGEREREKENEGCVCVYMCL